MSDKKKKLLDIIRQIQEIYPHLDRLMISDVEHPDQIVITSQEAIEAVAVSTGLDMDEIEEFFDEDVFTEEEMEELEAMIFEDDDDEGLLQ